jgi:CHAT domain-containing protein
VLLEEAGVVVVPHGPFLLDRLTNPPPVTMGKGKLLLVGNVNYGPKPTGTFPSEFRELKYTREEVQQISSLATSSGGAEPIMIEEEKATTAAVLAEIPNASIAHISTHGFFEENTPEAKFERILARFGESPADLRSPEARNPLVRNGLALAGANKTPPAADPDFGRLTAEVITGRRLGNLRLAVLSACETGLGRDVGREGVFGLQRAFHLAGCPTVIASLWSVDDKGTRDLMESFYRHLWTDGPDATPAKALRAAQLELYRKTKGAATTPRAVTEVPPIAPPPAIPNPEPGSRFDANTYFWGAFVISGG